MILVVGGLASGKRTYVRGLGIAEEDAAFDVHEFVRDDEDYESLAEELACKSAVTCAEVGNGIVPLDRGERAWRERAGRMMCLLAEKADTVVRMVCGVPVVLKGDAERHQSRSRNAVASSIELILIRHGQTPGNGEKRYVGAVDQPLSEVGRAQAAAARSREDVRRVYVSTLVRTHETAALMFPDADQVVVPGIQEMDFGAFAGRSADEMADDPAYRAWVDGNCEGACPGGESQAEHTDRVCAAMELLLREASARGEERLVMVAHGGTMMAFLSRYGNDPSKQYWEWLVGNCEGYRIGVDVSDTNISVRSLARW